MSNIIKNDKIIAWIKIVVGISMTIAVLIGYLPIPEYLVEFTCISNTSPVCSTEISQQEYSLYLLSAWAACRAHII